jgi:hypothetical protein
MFSTGLSVQDSSGHWNMALSAEMPEVALWGDRRVDGVLGPGPVDRNDEDPVIALDENLGFGAHTSSRMVALA